MQNFANIILILSDDQGEWAMGCSGNKEIQTPNIDRIAKEGMRFANFFCASPVCSPARASLLTGSLPSQHGVHDWLRDDDEKQSATEYLSRQFSYTKALCESGYVCALSGKWHLGNSAKPQQGFSHWYCHQSGGGPYYGASVYRNGTLCREEGYLTEAITEDALSFLESRREEKTPFYLQVGYTAPHAPWLNNHPETYTKRYENCPFESVPHLPRNPNSIYLTDEVMKEERGNLMGYYGAVTAMDAGIGRILEQLDSMGIRENTLLVFTSDNGFSCGHHGFWGKGNATFPLNLYEESVKVPFLASMPGTVPRNTVCDDLVSAYDFMPTVLDFCGIPIRDDVKRPGVSFWPALLGKGEPQRENVVVFDEYGPNRMIRTRDKKLICRYPYGPDELYDLSADPHEERNLLTDERYEALSADLRGELERWFAQYVNPEIDGVREAVFGTGQIGLAGLWGNGQPAHSRDAYLRKNPNYKPFETKVTPHNNIMERVE